MTQETEPSAETRWPAGVGMIYLGMSPWNSMWKNRHQLMSRFALQMPVLYVEPPVFVRSLRDQGLTSASFWRGFRTPLTRSEGGGLHVMQSPHYLPVSGPKGVGAFLRRRWLAAIRSSARRAGIARPILWISLPEQASAVGHLGEALSLYHIVDEYSGYTVEDEGLRQRLMGAEQALLDSVDLSIVVSDELMAAKSDGQRQVYLVENAVDYGRFAEARQRAATPPDLAAIPGPRLGYSGLIGKRLNLSLLGALAKAHPDWSLVLLGKVDRRQCEAELVALESMNNVHFLGRKEPHEVPDYVTGLDVGLLPYEINTETQHISPLKMFEYLGAGLPVVSTGIPAARRKAAFVAIGEDSASFIRACEDAVAEDRCARFDERVSEAAANTWDQRVEQISTLLRRHLGAGV